MPLEARFSDAIQARALQKRCDQTLEVIHHPDPRFFLNDDDKEALKQEYNQLSHKIRDLTGETLPDPLVFLPPEIWTDIIRVAADENDINLPPTDVVLLLTLVSNEWSRKILNNPRLWTNITIGRGETDAQAKLVTALCLSGDLHFDLTINFIPCHWEAELSCLQVHAHRMKRIAVQGSARGYISYDSDIPTRFMRHFFASFTHLPALKAIRTEHELQLNWEDIFAKCPALSYIYGTVVPFEILRNRSKVPIRGCSIDARSSDVIPHLEKLVYLEELIWELIDDAAVGGQHPLPPLVNMRHIDSSNVHNASVSIILKSVPNLTRLTLTINNSWRGIYDLFFHLKHLPHLLFLELELRDVRGSIAFTATQPIETGVQILQFIGEEENGTEERNQEAFVNQEALFSVFPVYFPNVKQLYLSFGFFGPSVTAYICAAKYLRSLTIHEVAMKLDYDLPITSSSLEFLDLAYVGTDPFVSNVEFPSLLRAKFGEEYSLHDMVEWRNSSIYSNIVHLETNSHQAQRQIRMCNALRKLRIWGEVGGRPWTDGVLITFICEPDICPSLREVEIEFIPEWDLLFLMLERRNYLPQSRGIARIETLILPSPIPPHLAVPLTEILRGRFTKRPSEHDLSFGGFLEAYFDPAVPGCRTCIASLMSCSSKAEPQYFYSPIFNDITLPSDQPEMSTETWKWLLERGDRVLEWEKRYDAQRFSNFYRKELCTTMQIAQRPFIITAH